jgi:predicted class III extradiol MEMO1 family dioxygenase
VSGDRVDAPVRLPAVAGSFYPSSPDRLDALVTGLFEAAERLPGATDPRATQLPDGSLLRIAGR